MKDVAKTILIVILLIIVIIIGGMWWSYQWTVCMEKIGDFYYCLQHIF